MSWKEQAICSPEQRSYFYPEGSPNTRRRQTEMAKAVCSACPVVAECLDYALANEPYGTWGGQTEIEREHIRHSRGMSPLLPFRTHQKHALLRNLAWPA